MATASEREVTRDELTWCDRERFDWLRQRMTPARRRVLEAVRDDRVVIRSIPDPTSDGDGRYIVVEVTHGRRLAKAAWTALYHVCFGIGDRVETSPGEWTWRAVLKPVGVALIADQEAPR